MLPRRQWWHVPESLSRTTWWFLETVTQFFSFPAGSWAPDTTWLVLPSAFYCCSAGLSKAAETQAIFFVYTGGFLSWRILRCILGRDFRSKMTSICFRKPSGFVLHKLVYCPSPLLLVTRVVDSRWPLFENKDLEIRKTTSFSLMFPGNTRACYFYRVMG